MFRFACLLLMLSLGFTQGYKNPHYFAGRTTMVHLFEWKWDDIATECVRFLGPKGFGGIQVSPPNENLIIWSRSRPWWERYQPMSYRLKTRSGNEAQFANMVTKCNEVGVRIYVDAVINHMTGDWPNSVGTGGSRAIFNSWYYPAVPYTRDHFNWPQCGFSNSAYECCPEKVRNCQLNGLKDLNQGNEHVRDQIVKYMNILIYYGVAGFRINAAQNMWPGDLKIIYDRLHNLNEIQGFPPNSRPFIFQEVVNTGSESLSVAEYIPIGAITEYKFGMELSRTFQGQHPLRNLVNWGTRWGLIPSNDALTFIDSYETQRGYGPAGTVLTFKEPKAYKAAIAFMLAHPYGNPLLMSSYGFHDSEAGPPMSTDGDIISPSINNDNSCGNGWVCEHRWRQVHSMVIFRNLVGRTAITAWWDNGGNQIAFSRAGLGFIAFNNDYWDLHQSLQTNMPAGLYCDVISGEKVGKNCTGKKVAVRNDGVAFVTVRSNDPDMMLAIHVGSESRL